MTSRGTGDAAAGAARTGARRSVVLRAGRGAPATAPVPDFAEQVLDIVDAIPVGRVMSYGDVAEYLGRGGPRQVGRVMAVWGGGVAWWRVIRADGVFLPGHERRALGHYREEGTPLRRVGGDGDLRVDMTRARWSGAQSPSQTS